VRRRGAGLAGGVLGEEVFVAGIGGGLSLRGWVASLLRCDGLGRLSGSGVVGVRRGDFAEVEALISRRVSHFAWRWR
jgi:hypothetical protein